MKQLNLFGFPKDTKKDNVVCITDGRGYRKPEEGKVVPILRIHRPREERLENTLYSGKNNSADPHQWD